MKHKKTFMLDLSHNKEHYTMYPRQAARTIYMLFLLILTICNFLIFLALVPLIIFIKSDVLLIIIVGLGLLFGIIFNFLIKDIEHLEPKHHFFAAIYIPLISVLNILVLAHIGRIAQGKTAFPPKDLFYLCLTYIIMFLLPYSVDSIVAGHRKEEKKTIRHKLGIAANSKL